ncbi:esterase/lipase family protein [Streptomyces sp. NPDC088762]|uniref:esterase/lipase family protein n=1 Tax=Streptomyces sp. NPDC088762 TaxID=3365891 RepID=UPI0037FD37D3
MKKSVFPAALVSLLLTSIAVYPAHAATGTFTFGPTSNPILFVHGYNSSGSYWNAMADEFRADGWPSTHLRQWSYDTRQSNATTAQQIATEVDRLLAATGATKVDVITHSMGGLSSRYYAKNLGGSQKIDAWVSLGGPNHGTDWANGCYDASCVEMRIGSTFLGALNSGDETPGNPRYATWWSPCDAVINPDSSVALSGATNTKTACLSHNALGSDPTVYGQVRDHVNS